MKGKLSERVTALDDFRHEERMLFTLNYAWTGDEKHVPAADPDCVDLKERCHCELLAIALVSVNARTVLALDEPTAGAVPLPVRDFYPGLRHAVWRRF